MSVPREELAFRCMVAFKDEGGVMPVRLNGEGAVAGVTAISATPVAPPGVSFLPDGSVEIAGIGVFPVVAAPQEGDTLIFQDGRWQPNGAGQAVFA